MGRRASEARATQPRPQPTALTPNACQLVEWLEEELAGLVQRCDSLERITHSSAGDRYPTRRSGIMRVLRFPCGSVGALGVVG